MFEKLISRAAAIAGSAARRRSEDLAEAWRGEAPAGVRIEAAPEGVILSGRDLARRFALDPALRFLGRRR